MQFIKALEDLKLIKVSKEPASKLETYLKKMRRHTDSAPGLEEITEIVEGVRAARYAKKLQHFDFTDPR